MAEKEKIFEALTKLWAQQTSILIDCCTLYISVLYLWRINISKEWKLTLTQAQKNLVRFSFCKLPLLSARFFNCVTIFHKHWMLLGSAKFLLHRGMNGVIYNQVCSAAAADDDAGATYTLIWKKCTRSLSRNLINFLHELFLKLFFSSLSVPPLFPDAATISTSKRRLERRLSFHVDVLLNERRNALTSKEEKTKKKKSNLDREKECF